LAGLEARWRSVDRRQEVSLLGAYSERAFPRVLAGSAFFGGFSAIASGGADGWPRRRSRRRAHRSSVWGRLALRPSNLGRGAKYADGAIQTRRGEALTANGIDCGASLLGVPLRFRPV
jgi:hypothetical protein